MKLELNEVAVFMLEVDVPDLAGILVVVVVCRWWVEECCRKMVGETAVKESRELTFPRR